MDDRFMSLSDKIRASRLSSAWFLLVEGREITEYGSFRFCRKLMGKEKR